ncbi:MAG: type I secretion C-terminal target domain-containing protein, partial [Limnohabitans sp.]
KAGNDIIFGDGFAGTDIIFSGPASGATGGQGGYGGGGAAGAISTSVPLQASIGGGAGGFGDSYLVSSGSAPTNPSYAGKANTMGMASPVDLFSSGNGLYLPAPGAGVTTNGSSFTSPSTTSVTAMLTKATYDKVLSDISKNSTDLRVFTQVMGTGNDLIDAGPGWDWVMGGYGNDTIIGGKGNDVLWGRGGGAHFVNLNITQGGTTATETTNVVFADGLKVGESATVGGLTLTATSDMTAANLANAFANLADGANTGSTVTGVSYTASGGLSGWSSGAIDNTLSASTLMVKFTSSTANANVTDLSASYKLWDNDIFRWVAGDGSSNDVDTVKDFTAWNGTEGDKLDILGLLTSYISGASVLSQWVTVATGQTAPTGTANSTKITIDIDGTGPVTTAQTIWLEGVTLSSINADTLKANGVLIA